MKQGIMPAESHCSCLAQIVYGPRAIEAVFGFSGIGGGAKDLGFDAGQSAYIALPCTTL